MSESETKLRQLGPYVLTRKLGQGTTGTVYLARQESLGRDLAIKVLDPEFSRDADFVKRFQREGRIAASLRHPNIIQVLDACSSEGVYYIVMEFVTGSDLQALMASPQRPDWHRAVEYAACILDALDHAHRNGVIHRDVKPANVLLNAAGQVILTDFSVAHMKEGTRLTSAGSLLGTPEYMAPEQFDSVDIDGRADIYAASLLLYEMLTGVHPFRAKSMPEVVRAQLFTTPKSPDVLNPEVPRGVAEVVMKGLAKKPADRHAKAADMAELLREASRVDASAPRDTARIDSSRSASASAVTMPAATTHEQMSVLTTQLDFAAASTSSSLSGADLQKELRDRLNYIFRRSRAQAMEWSGDGAIVLFADAPQALKCARSIHQELNNERQAIRLAIASGEIFLDPKYADSRPSLGQFACQTVDNADRMAKECPPGGLLICPNTLPSAPSHMTFKSIGKRHDGLEVFALEEVHATLPAIPGDENDDTSSAATIVKNVPNRVPLGPAPNPFASGQLPPPPSNPTIPNNPFTSGQLPPPPVMPPPLNSPFNSGQLPPMPATPAPLNNPFTSGQLPAAPPTAPPSNNPFASGQLPQLPPNLPPMNNPFGSGQLPATPPSLSNPFASGQLNAPAPEPAKESNPFSSGPLPTPPSSPNPFSSGQLPGSPFASGESGPRTNPFASQELPPLPANPFSSSETPPPGFPSSSLSQPAPPPGFPSSSLTQPSQPSPPPGFPSGSLSLTSQPSPPPGFPSSTLSQPGAPPGFPSGSLSQSLSQAPPGFPSGALSQPSGPTESGAFRFPPSLDSVNESHLSTEPPESSAAKSSESGGPSQSSDLNPPEAPKRKATLARSPALPDKQPQLTLQLEEPREFPKGKVAAGILVLGLGAAAAFKFWPSTPPPKATPTPKPNTGAVVIKCEPAKVEISVDNGKSKPYQNGARIELQGGPHTFDVSAKGFKKFNKKITVKVGQPLEFKIKLQKVN